MATVQVEGHIWPEGLTDDQKKLFEIRGYYNPRLIQGKLCGVFQNYPDEYLVVGITVPGLFEREYLYKSNQAVSDAINKYTNLDEHPSGPWIRCEGLFKGEEIDVLNAHVQQ